VEHAACIVGAEQNHLHFRGMHIWHAFPHMKFESMDQSGSKVPLIHRS